MRSCSGLVSTTSADGPADSWAAVFSISLELVHAPSASAEAAAMARALTATRGPRRKRVITVVLSPRSGRAHGRAPPTGGTGCAVRGSEGGSEHAGQEGIRPLVLGVVEHLLGRP